MYVLLLLLHLHMHLRLPNFAPLVAKPTLRLLFSNPRSTYVFSQFDRMG